MREEDDGELTRLFRVALSLPPQREAAVYARLQASIRKETEATVEEAQEQDSAWQGFAQAMIWAQGQVGQTARQALAIVRACTFSTAAAMEAVDR